MLRATRLRCEHQENPVGIGERSPRFSWVIESDGSPSRIVNVVNWPSCQRVKPLPPVPIQSTP